MAHSTRSRYSVARRYLTGLSLIVALCAGSPPFTAAADKPTPRITGRVVIDPGHGGTEDGAIGPSGSKEKDVVLDVSRRVATLLRAQGFEVWLAREGDEDVPLENRAAVANTHKADLFVSVHVNASRFNGARGAETYVLAAQATDNAARTTAALENDAAGVTAAAGEGGDGDLKLILWDLAQVEYLEASSKLAGAIQAGLNEALGLKDRGVRQAPFKVLVGATCPAVLVELGFISNPDEEKLLGDDAYRQKLAQVLAEAIRRFKGGASGS